MLILQLTLSVAAVFILQGRHDIASHRAQAASNLSNTVSHAFFEIIQFGRLEIDCGAVS